MDTRPAPIITQREPGDHREEPIVVYAMVNGVIIPYRKEGREIGVGRIRRFLETGTIINGVEGSYNVWDETDRAGRQARLREFSQSGLKKRFGEPEVDVGST